MDSIELLKELTEADGLPGYEGEIREIFKRHLHPLATIESDRLGSVIASKEGTTKKPKIMLAGHMDEIGFMVKLITEEGYIKFSPLGGWWSQTLLSQRVKIKTTDGPVMGMIGSKAPHIMEEEESKKIVKMKDMFIDIGASDREEAESFGVRPGDPIFPCSEFTVLSNENLLMSKAWDDRVGCALVIDLIKKLEGVEHPNTVYGVGTVQEEVGLRGAKTSASQIDPDLGIALDVCIAGDVPGVKDTDAMSAVGDGPAILLYDSSLIPNLQLRDLVVDVAKENEIPYQFDLIERGGTDAGRIHLNEAGVPSIVISIPTRYIHSHNGILSIEDYNHTLNLLYNLIMSLDYDTVNSLVD